MNLKNKNKRKWCVYIHTSPSNKKYVGVTSKPPHIRWGYRGKNYMTQMFYRAIQKYGWDNIKHEVIAENLTQEEALKMEIALIEKHRTTERDYGYNVSTGGKGANGIKLSTEKKKKLSDKRQGVNACGFGTFPSEETKKRMSESAKNKKFSKDTKQKMAQAKSKKVYQYTLNGDFINSYNSASEAGAILNINVGNLCACCRGVVRSAGGYFWSYNYIDNKQVIVDIQNKSIELIKIKTRNEKSVFQLDLNENIINTYKSLKEASEATEIPAQEISQSCKNPNKVTRFFKWRFVNESNNTNNG